MRTLAPSILLILLFALATRTPGRALQNAPAADTGQPCAPLGSSFMRTTLYFGLTRPTGAVTESQWKGFLKSEVTPRFPQGLTVWEANGQWLRADGNIIRERSKVLLLVHDEAPPTRKALSEVVERYKKLFQQESVLWESARVCAAF